MGHICAASCPCKFKLRSFPSCHELVPPLVGQKSPQGREAHRVLVSNLQEQHGESHHRLSLEFERESLQAPLIPRHDPTFETTASSMPSSRYDDTLSRVTSRISSLENCNGLCSCSCTGGEAPWVYIGPEISYWAQWYLVGQIEDATEVHCEQGDEEEINDGWNGTRRSKSENTEREWRLLGEIHAAWVSLGTMLKWSKVLELRNTFKYLAAWLLLSDGKSYQIHLTYGLWGFSTITSTVALFAKASLHMQASLLILIGLITPLSGILGSLLWPQIQRTFSLSNLSILVLLTSLVPFLGFLFQSFSFRFGGLTAPREMFGLWYFPRICESVLCRVDSEGRGSQMVWFIFNHGQEQFISWSISGGSHCGFDREYQICISFTLVGMIWITMPILWSVDAEKGRMELCL